MRFFYPIVIYFYGLILKAVSWFNPKAKLWVDGRKKWREKLQATLPAIKNNQRIWIHCASVGEFEQGRPVIEQIKNTYPEAFIVLSFFSPSGFELRKNFDKADLVCYLPLDTKKNAQDWIEIIQPDIALFVKYEFWPNMLLALQKQEIPTLYFSSIFRENQHFFSWYGSWFKKILQNIPFIFVQQQKSIDLLNSIGIKNCAIAGDTRFDRVSSIANQIKPIPFIEAFINNEITLIAGSTWSEDEKLLVALSQKHSNIKLIIAPHEIDLNHIRQIEKRFGNKAICYSKATIESLKHSSVLIIDNIGMLSSLYQYADITYIGGGFGKGIHNTLETAVYGSPIIFGPKYSKFQEALDLLHLKAAFSVDNYQGLLQAFENLLDINNRETASLAAKNYVSNNTGGTEKVMDWINTELSAKPIN